MRFLFRFAASPCLALAGISPAHAVDLQPAEVRAPLPGLTSAQLFYQESERGDAFRQGHRQAGAPRLLTSMLTTRVGHSFEIDGHPAAFSVQAGSGSVRPGGSLSAAPDDSGVTDTTLLLAVWPYANHQTETYFGVGAYLGLPTGSYDNRRSFNVGANRYNGALQAGFDTALVGRLHWMIAVDTVWFGQNSDFGPRHAELEQQNLRTVQSSLRYEFDSVWMLAAGYFNTEGGETSVNGVPRNDVTRLQRYQLSGIAALPFGRLTLQYGADLKTANGFIEDRRWGLRYSRVF